MSTAKPVPHYVTLAGGQVRIWQAGSGSDLVALAGPTLSAAATAARLASACPGWRITMIELPGIGGSARHAASTVAEIAACAEAVIEALGITGHMLVAFELAGVVARRIATSENSAAAAVHLVGAERARCWSHVAPSPPPLSPRQDGGHLVALWSFIRDRHLLEPGDPGLPAARGEPLPGANELDDTLTAAAVAPDRFHALWTMLAGEAGELPAGDDLLLEQLPARLGGPRSGGTNSAPPRTVAPEGDGIWHQYVETARGRMHLRRSGGSGRPTLVIPTGGGSSAQFAPVVQGLTRGRLARQVFAVDYLGNGLSDKPDRQDVTTGELAEDMHALLDALGYDAVDVWGSHTGALVGLELAIRHPERVGRLVDGRTGVHIRGFPE